ncbi:MAG TPA: hypothetical protein VFU23_02600 [Gemmatimonadales bacterium]|nr:hypothetical protein [Gemmatimonadales bacterium]
MTARSDLSRLVRAGLLTALVDGLFSSLLAVFIYRTGFARLWQGVASTLLGPSAINGGTTPVLIGLLMHLGVAFGWSTVFLVLLYRRRWIQNLLASPNGVLKVAALYGPCIWLVMSLVVIPLLVHRPTAITVRWWVQLIGHIPFVAVPIVSSIAGARGEPAGAP